MTPETNITANDSAQEEVEAKTAEDIKAEIAEYRRLIKIGETADRNGNYNEALVLDSEDKLRRAEKELQSLEAVKKRQEELEKNSMIATDKSADELKENIAGLRENIKRAEKTDNEKLVLENEASLREAEQMLRYREAEDEKDRELEKIRLEIKEEAESTSEEEPVKETEETPAAEIVEDFEDISAAAYEQIDDFPETLRREKEEEERKAKEKIAQEKQAKKDSFWKNLSTLFGGVNEKK